MKKCCLFAMILLGVCHVSWAETLYLKNGKKIDVEILDRSSYNIKVKQNGRLKTYYLDQIERIEEDIAESEVVVNIDFEKFTDTRRSKVEWILKLIEVNGTMDVLKTNIDLIIEKAPVEQREEMREIFNLKGLIEELIPVFDEHYTELEIRQLVIFYESPTGQKVIRETPAVMEEVMQKTVNYLLEKANR